MRLPVPKGGAGFLSQPQAPRKTKFTTQTFVGYNTIPRQNSKRDTATLSRYRSTRQGIIKILLRAGPTAGAYM